MKTKKYKKVLYVRRCVFIENIGEDQNKEKKVFVGRDKAPHFLRDPRLQLIVLLINPGTPRGGGQKGSSPGGPETQRGPGFRIVKIECKTTAYGRH